MGGEDLSETHNRFDQCLHVPWWFTAHALQNFVTAQLLKHLSGFAFVHREQTDRNVL